MQLFPSARSGQMYLADSKTMWDGARAISAFEAPSTINHDPMEEKRFDFPSPTAPKSVFDQRRGTSEITKTLDDFLFWHDYNKPKCTHTFSVKDAALMRFVGLFLVEMSSCCSGRTWSQLKPIKDQLECPVQTLNWDQRQGCSTQQPLRYNITTSHY